MASMQRQKLISLPVQMISFFVFLIIITVLAIGVPAIWLLHQQLDRLTWRLVSQGSQTTQALLLARQSELNSLALITSQRPTLDMLVGSGDQEELVTYLETLRQGAQLDLILLCDAHQQAAVQVGAAAPAQACQAPAAGAAPWLLPAGEAPGWLLAAQPMANQPVTVIVGWALDAAFMDRIYQETGMEQFFIQDGKLVAGSLPVDGDAWQKISASLPVPDLEPQGQATNGTFTLNDTTYYATRSRYGQPGFETIISLPVTDIINVQRRLTWSMIIGLIAITLVSSVLGGLLTRRIGTPLGDCAIRLLPCARATW